MHLENLAKLGEYLKSQGMQAALISNPFNITWLTGYAPPIQTGPSPFEGGPTLGWFQDGELTLLLNDWEADSETMGAKCFLCCYTIDEPYSRATHAAALKRCNPYAPSGKWRRDTMPAPYLARRLCKQIW
jgi:hypothetical protein